MREDLTDIVCIVDRSSSMASVRRNVVKGLNRFISRQKLEAGKANLTIVFFDTKQVTLYEGVDLHEINPISQKSYTPSGCTALYDAVGLGINATLRRRRNTPREQRASAVIFCIFSDGQDNRSLRFAGKKGNAEIRAKIDKLRPQGWEFIFLGTDKASMESARKMGIPPVRRMLHNKNAATVENAYAANMSAAVSVMRNQKRLPDDSWKRVCI